jgi:hypothetical protein
MIGDPNAKPTNQDDIKEEENDSGDLAGSPLMSTEDPRDPVTPFDKKGSMSVLDPRSDSDEDKKEVSSEDRKRASSYDSPLAFNFLLMRGRMDIFRKKQERIAKGTTPANKKDKKGKKGDSEESPLGNQDSVIDSPETTREGKVVNPELEEAGTVSEERRARGSPAKEKSQEEIKKESNTEVSERLNKKLFTNMKEPVTAPKEMAPHDAISVTSSQQSGLEGSEREREASPNNLARTEEWLRATAQNNIEAGAATAPAPAAGAGAAAEPRGLKSAGVEAGAREPVKELWDPFASPAVGDVDPSLKEKRAEKPMPDAEFNDLLATPAVATEAARRAEAEAEAKRAEAEASRLLAEAETRRLAEAEAEKLRRTLEQMENILQKLSEIEREAKDQAKNAQQEELTEQEKMNEAMRLQEEKNKERDKREKSRRLEEEQLKLMWLGLQADIEKDKERELTKTRDRARALEEGSEISEIDKLKQELTDLENKLIIAERSKKLLEEDKELAGSERNDLRDEVQLLKDLQTLMYNSFLAKEESQQKIEAAQRAAADTEKVQFEIEKTALTAEIARLGAEVNAVSAAQKAAERQAAANLAAEQAATAALAAQKKLADDAEEALKAEQVKATAATAAAAAAAAELATEKAKTLAAERVAADELKTAHDRIAELEKELAELRKRVAAEATAAAAAAAGPAAAPGGGVPTATPPTTPPPPPPAAAAAAAAAFNPNDWQNIDDYYKQNHEAYNSRLFYSNDANKEKPVFVNEINRLTEFGDIRAANFNLRINKLTFKPGQELTFDQSKSSSICSIDVIDSSAYLDDPGKSKSKRGSFSIKTKIHISKDSANDLKEYQALLYQRAQTMLSSNLISFSNNEDTMRDQMALISSAVNSYRDIDYLYRALDPSSTAPIPIADAITFLITGSYANPAEGTVLTNGKRRMEQEEIDTLAGLADTTTPPFLFDASDDSHQVKLAEMAKGMADNIVQKRLLHDIFSVEKIDSTGNIIPDDTEFSAIKILRSEDVNHRNKITIDASGPYDPRSRYLNISFGEGNQYYLQIKLARGRDGKAIIADFNDLKIFDGKGTNNKCNELSGERKKEALKTLKKYKMDIIATNGADSQKLNYRIKAKNNKVKIKDSTQRIDEPKNNTSLSLEQRRDRIMGQSNTWFKYIRGGPTNVHSIENGNKHRTTTKGRLFNRGFFYDSNIVSLQPIVSSDQKVPVNFKSINPTKMTKWGHKFTSAVRRNSFGVFDEPSPSDTHIENKTYDKDNIVRTEITRTKGAFRGWGVSRNRTLNYTTPMPKMEGGASGLPIITDSAVGRVNSRRQGGGGGPRVGY